VLIVERYAMPKTNNTVTIQSHFEGKSLAVCEIYEQLLKVSKTFGRVTEDPKKTSIHLVNTTAFAGIATRKDSLILTLKSNRKLTSPRIFKSEQASAQRFHHQIKLTSPADINDEIIVWLRDAYTLSA
jgi:hypothetical protein